MVIALLVVVVTAIGVDAAAVREGWSV